MARWSSKPTAVALLLGAVVHCLANNSLLSEACHLMECFAARLLIK